MRAATWQGVHDVRVCEVPDPQILQPTDAIIRVTSAAICGSDLHMYDGYISLMQKGDVLGHEAMGVVTEVGDEVRLLSPGDRIVVAFPIACGSCWYCQHGMYSLCDNSNPDAWIPEKLYGSSPAGLFGYSHAYGGFPGGQAEYLRIPFADVGHIKVPSHLEDEQVLFLSDVLSTGWFAADNADIHEGDDVAVWGAGPVGQFAMISAWHQGAGRVFAIDNSRRRLCMAEEFAGATPLDHEELGIMGVQRQLRLHTGGRGPDCAIDAAGMESTDGPLGAYHKIKQSLRLEQDRPVALTEAIMACRKGGTVSVPGVFTGLVDKFPMGALFSKGLTMRGGQTPVQRYADELLGMIDRGEIDPTFIITQRVSLNEVPECYRMLRESKDAAVKVVVKP